MSKLINFVKNYWKVVKNKYVLLGSLIIFIAAITTIGISITAQTDNYAAEIGKKAPDFTLTGFAGNQLKLSNFQGKPVVLIFWGTWCLSCLDTLKNGENIYQEFKDKISILGVHRSDFESTARAALIAQKLPISFILLKDLDGTVYAKYKFSELMPLTYFIDSNGIVVERVADLANEELIRNNLQKLQGLK